MNTSRKKHFQTILLVDDDADMLELFRTVLESHGYNAIRAETGREALLILDQISAPDLILLDFNLSDMKGPKFVKILGERNPTLFKRVPIVYLSSESKIRPTKDIGFIQKSSDMDLFLRSVDQYAHSRPAPTP